MKTFCSFKCVFFIFVLVFSFVSVLSAQEPSEKTDRAIDEEMKWLKAEAEATIVTVATKTRMGVNEAPSIVSVITEEEIKNSGSKNLIEVLRQVAGFNVYMQAMYPDTALGIRGSVSNSRFKIMINGHSAENAFDINSGWIIAFPAELIKKIEIIRGPGSALYGNSAMNGVINILTKDGKDPSAISGAYGSFNTYTGTGQASYSENDLSIFLFADRIKSKGDPQLIEKDAASAMFPPGFSLAPGYSEEEFYSDSFFTKLFYKNVYLTGFFNNSKRENSVGLSNALTDENEIRDPFGFAEAGYEGSLTEKIRLYAKAYYDYKHQDLKYELFDQNTSVLLGFPQGQSVTGNAELKIGKIGSEVMMTISFHDNAEIVIGTLFEYHKAYNIRYKSNTNIIGKDVILDGFGYMQYLGGMRDFTKDFGESYKYIDEDKAERNIYAGYIQGTWDISESFPCFKHIGKNLTLTAGLRYDNYDDVGSSLSPRVGVVYTPNDKLFFKILYGEAFRAPSFSELYYMNNPAQVGNPNLKPETVKTAEILAGLNLTDNITATLDFFHVQNKDAIKPYQISYDNRGEIESQGAEAEIKAAFDKNKYAYFNITYQKASDKSHESMTDSGGTVYTQEDSDPGLYPRFIANFGINYEINRYINADLSANYIGSTERSDRMQFTPDKNDADGTVEKADKRDNIDSYTLVNLSLIFRNFDFAKGWEFQVTGYNIFDADQRDPTDITIENDLPRWDRHFLGKLTYTF